MTFYNVFTDKEEQVPEGMCEERSEQLAMFDARDRYFKYRYGDCEEPVFDPLFGTWVLEKKERGNMTCYLCGSAEKIFSRFFGIEDEFEGTARTALDEYRQCSVTTGCIDSLFWAAWTDRPEGADTVLEDNGLMSEKQKKLWNMVREYANEHRCER